MNRKAQAELAYERILLPALLLIALAAGLGLRSWLIGLEVLFGIPLAIMGLFAIGGGIQFTVALAKARRLSKRLRDPSADIRRDAACQLGKMGFRTGLADESLAHTMSADPDEGVRFEAALSLAKTGRRMRALAAPQLGRALFGPQGKVAARALEGLGCDASSALEDLSRAYMQGVLDQEGRIVLIRTLGNLVGCGCPAAISTIMASLSDQDDQVAMEAIRWVSASARKERKLNPNPEWEAKAREILSALASDIARAKVADHAARVIQELWPTESSSTADSVA